MDVSNIIRGGTQYEKNKWESGTIITKSAMDNIERWLASATDELIAARGDAETVGDRIDNIEYNIRSVNLNQRIQTIVEQLNSIDSSIRIINGIIENLNSESEEIPNVGDIITTIRQLENIDASITVTSSNSPAASFSIVNKELVGDCYLLSLTIPFAKMGLGNVNIVSTGNINNGKVNNEDIVSLSDTNTLNPKINFNIPMQSITMGNGDIEILSASSSPAASLEGDGLVKTLKLKIPRGDTGEKGDTGAAGADGAAGATFTPVIDANGNLSWTNDGGKQNPDPVNIKGPQGLQGNAGPTPIFQVGNVTSIDPNDTAEVTIVTTGTVNEKTASPQNPIINFSLPRGQTGSIDNFPTASSDTIGGVKIASNGNFSINNNDELNIKLGNVFSVNNETGEISISKATTEAFGVVKIGNNISVDNTGTISVPIADSTTLGVVKKGSGLSINTAGVISVATATTSTKGIVKIGSNISVNSGTISVPTASTETAGVIKVGNTLTINNGTLDVLTLPFEKDLTIEKIAWIIPQGSSYNTYEINITNVTPNTECRVYFVDDTDNYLLSDLNIETDNNRIIFTTTIKPQDDLKLKLILQEVSKIDNNNIS